MISTGVSDISVDAMPVSVYCTDINERETPITGPNNVVNAAYFSPLRSSVASCSFPRSFYIAMMARKPRHPIKALVIVEAKGIIVRTASGASIGMTEE